ncbi:MAG: asparagine synthase (glutamine-hydrolyzing) [Flavipsychrobacter sp.]|nr:asparagine synthase (glutamine-hydrolyzing) [Flavipsychrobacter sp.]
MCGILGAISSEKSLHKIEEKLSVLAHRGPDDSGFYKQGNLALGHLRLSIQDVSSNGHQPMTSIDGLYTIIFNGEIYNHWEIRKDLEAAGFTFRSTSDTETLLYAYIAYGNKCLDKLNGIFAFAIHNRKDETLFIARDNFGVKPLYYYFDGSHLFFSSEMKALLDFEELNYDLAPEAFYNYLLLLWSPGETTPFRKIKKMLPGHYAEVKLNDIASFAPVQYYKVPFNGAYRTDRTEKEWIDILDEQLNQVVKRQLLSDVPVGFFLSGGLDSSLLAAITRRLYPNEPLKAYTIDTGRILKQEGFAEDLPYAKKVAAHTNIDLQIIQADINILNDFDKMIWHLDEPQADASPLNVLNISREAHNQDYKVLLCGSGGDDIFSGYRRHRALRIDNMLSGLPMIAKKGIKGIASIWPNNVTGRRIKKLVADIELPDHIRRMSFFFWLKPHRALELFTQEYRERINKDVIFDFFSGLNAEIPLEKDPLNQMLFWEIRSFLVDHNLNYMDKLSMAASIETRVPYMDKELVELSTQIPPHLKLKGDETKYLLKKVAERYLPNEVIYRPKTGFVAPIRKWIKEDMQEMIKERLLSDDFYKWGIFDKKAIETLIRDNATGKIEAAYTIWSLLAIESWLRQFAAK